MRVTHKYQDNSKASDLWEMNGVGEQKTVEESGRRDRRETYTDWKETEGCSVA